MTIEIHKSFLEWKIHPHATVTSTQDVLKELIQEQGASFGTVVCAKMQTKGRGRHAREWVSPPGGLYVSVYLPDLGGGRGSPHLLGTLAGCNVLREQFGLRTAEVKWPNDLMVNGKKLGGFLAENVAEGVILGVGINLNVTLPYFPEQVRRHVTTVFHELGREISREQFLEIFLQMLGRLLERYQNGEWGALLAEYKAASGTLGQEVTLLTGTGEIVGTAVDLGPSGELIVRTADGRLKSVWEGEVVKAHKD